MSSRGITSPLILGEEGVSGGEEEEDLILRDLDLEVGELLLLMRGVGVVEVDVDKASASVVAAVLEAGGGKD